MLHSQPEIKALYRSFAAAHPFEYQPKALYEPIDYILNVGGKQLRPALVLMAANLFLEDIAPALPAAHAIEVFHNFTLVHDDIMDEAPLRRGMPTIHTKYDTNTAILSGDVMLIYAYEFLLQSPAPYIPNIIKAFNQAAIGVCEGQQYDVDFESRNDVTIPEYITMIRLKTAELIAGALQIGALIGGTSPENAAHAAEFGRNIGIAFQLQDDILDTYGDPKKFGKKVGGDIAQNKKTFLVLKSLELANESTAHQLNHWMNTTPSSENEAEKIAAVKQIFTDLDIPTHANVIKNKYLDKAYEHLNALDAPEARKIHLHQFAQKLVHRDI